MDGAAQGAVAKWFQRLPGEQLDPGSISALKICFCLAYGNRKKELRILQSDIEGCES